MRTALKWAAGAVAGLLVLILLVVGAMYFVGSSNLKTTYAVQTAALTIPTDSASIAHGRHVARINGCTDCHGAGLEGQVFVDAPPFRVVASNLTAGVGGIGGEYTATDFDRAIRHGIKKDGTPVIIMPSAAFHNLSDDDAAALIAYLERVPPVDNELPSTQVRFLGKVLASAMLDVDFEVNTAPARSRPAPPRGPTREYGQYLSSITCSYCHGTDLRGNQKPPIPESPPAPDLAGPGQWPLAAFESTLRTGVKPNGDSLDVEFMPISITSQMDDDDLEALHAHLATLATGATSN